MLAAYIATGQDSLKRKRIRERLLKKIDPSLYDFNVDTLDGAQVDAEALSNALFSLPFGGPLRLVFIEHAEKITAALADIVVSFLQKTGSDSEPQVVVLFESDALNKRSKLYKSVAALGKEAVIDCSTVKPWELPAYAQKQAQALGLTLSHPVAEALVARVVETPEAILNALESLAAYLDAQTSGSKKTVNTSRVVEMSHLEKVVPYTREAKPWEIVDALCNGETARALSQINHVPDEALLSFHRFYLERLRELICVHALQEKGIALSPVRIASAVLSLDEKAAMRLSWKYKQHARWGRRFTKKDLKEALYAAKYAESSLKGKGDARLGVYKMVAALIKT